MFSSSMLRDLVDTPTRMWDRVFYDPSSYYLNPTSIHSSIVRPRPQNTLNFFGQSGSKADPSKFRVMVNVNHFLPYEIQVKMIDNYVVVHGRHEERLDEHGFISREFSRRYPIPDDVEPENIVSALGKDGILTIQAARDIMEKASKRGESVPKVIHDPSAVGEVTFVRKSKRFDSEENDRWSSVIHCQ